MRTNIYPSEKVLPYVYYGIHRITKQFYHGYREANRVPSSLDFGIKYFTSSRKVKELGFENFDWFILAEFFDTESGGDDAYHLEQDLIWENWKNPLKLNVKSQRYSKFSRAGKKNSEDHKRKTAESNIGRKHTEQAKENMSLGGKGRKKSQEHRDKIGQAHIGKKRDPSVGQKISARLKGRKQTPEEKAKQIAAQTGKKLGPQRQIKCPHCNKEGGFVNMNRYHFENCKTKNLE